MDNIIYCHNNSSKEEIFCHLKVMSPHFSIPLEGRVSIDSYADKLFVKAEREEAYIDGFLVGLVAYYVNDRRAFVSNVSVLPKYVGHGIGKKLLNQMKQYLKIKDVYVISMEVADNENIVNFYRNNGFDLGKQLDDNMHQMVRFQYNENPVVSIICLVYNHEHYLRDCFEGFIMQKTDFPIEILVHDDASTDGSVEIINEYHVKYPHLFKPIYQEKNQYSQGIPISLTYQYPRCKGKYIAICEGDDYWIDPYKLQKQVQCLEDDKDCILVYTNINVIDSNGDVIKIRQKKQNAGNAFQLLLKGSKRIGIPTLTVCMRAKEMLEAELELKKIPFKILMGDFPLWIILSHIGKFKYFSDITACYRYSHGSVSHALEFEKRNEFFYNAVQIRQYFAKKYNVHISSYRVLSCYYYSVLRYLRPNEKKYFDKIIKNILKQSPCVLFNYKILSLVVYNFVRFISIKCEK